MGARARCAASPRGAGFLAYLYPLVTTETFKTLFGFKPEMWQAFSILGAIMFGALTAGLSARWAYLKLTKPDRTAEEILREVVDQMTRERNQATAPAPAAGAPAP